MLTNATAYGVFGLSAAEWTNLSEKIKAGIMFLWFSSTDRLIDCFSVHDSTVS
jgi:hypothetical protein